MKIYNSRVDSVTTETGRLLSGLAGGGTGAEDEDGMGGMGEDAEDGQQEGEKKEKRKVSPKKRQGCMRERARAKIARVWGRRKNPNKRSQNRLPRCRSKSLTLNSPSIRCSRKRRRTLMKVARRVS